MAVPTSSNAVTVRRLSDVITGLWGKVKHKQTAKTSPSASGNTTAFIDTISQDAQGVITATKKNITEGSTSVKGIVKLQATIGTTESSDATAATPKAVRDAINSAISAAYRPSGTKEVAELSSSLLVAANLGCVYNMTTSGQTTSDFIEGAGKTIRIGDNVGICAITEGSSTVYKFDLLSGVVDLSNYVQKSSTTGLIKNDGTIDTRSLLTTTGASTSTTVAFTAASSRANIATGETLATMFGKIAKWFGDLKAMAFKANVTDSDISGTISDSHIASASTWNGKADGNHTHTLTLATDTGTSTVDLANNTTYKLTAGGSSIIFKTPSAAPANNGALKIGLNGGTATSIFTANQSTDSTLTFASGSANGTIAVDGTDIAVTGLGSAAYKADTHFATSGHTHATSIATSSGTNQITLAANTKYAITAGGTSYVFTTPPDTTYSSKSAASGGTEVSLCTTDEKYTWNNKQDKLTEMTTTEVDDLLAELT